MRIGLIVLGLAIATLPATAQVARYRLTVDVTWSEETHPGAFPEYAHFSWLGGGTHDASVSFWNEGQPTSFGMTVLAENGGTHLFEDEVEDAVDAGSAGSVLGWHYWFCPDGTDVFDCGEKVVEFDVDAAYPLVTLATMLGPSPDWFVGVNGLPLRDAEGWIDHVYVSLHPYDGGTRSANVWELGGPVTVPPEPITKITTESGQLVGPDSLGWFRFERIVAELTSATSTVSLTAGGSQVFELDAGAENAGALFWLLGSVTGTSPGLVGPPSLPLNVDGYTLLSVSYPNVAPFEQTLGFLDGTGRGTAVVTFRPDSDPTLAGIHLDHAYVLFDAPGVLSVSYASNAVGLDLVP